MRDGDLPLLKRELREMAELFPHSGEITDTRASAYYQVLKDFDIATVRKACRDVVGDEDRKFGFPAPAEIKRACRTYGEPHAERFYMPCQHIEWREGIREECKNEIEVDGNTRFCGKHAHDTVSGPPASREERIEVLQQATPKARAFLRSALPHLMADIPITDEEQTYAATPLSSPLPSAIESKLQGLPVAQAEAIRANWPTRRVDCPVCGEGYTSDVWHCRCDRHWSTEDAFCRSCGTAQTAMKGAG